MTSMIKWRKTAWSVYAILYSRKFSLVKNLKKISPDSSEEIFAGFIFMERMYDALTTPLPVAWHANWRKDTERWSEEACATTACWTETFSTADLNFKAHFFTTCIFVEAGLSTKIKRKFAPSKNFPLYGISLNAIRGYHCSHPSLFQSHQFTSRS